MHSCNYCNYKSDRIYNLKVHQRNKHGNQQNEPQLNTCNMHDYQQEQPAYCGQVAQQQPVYQNQVPLPSHMQNNSHLESLVIQNQYLKNKVNELQTFIRNQNVQTGKTGRKRFRSNKEIFSKSM